MNTEIVQCVAESELTLHISDAWMCALVIVLFGLPAVYSVISYLGFTAAGVGSECSVLERGVAAMKCGIVHFLLGCLMVLLYALGVTGVMPAAWLNSIVIPLAAVVLFFPGVASYVWLRFSVWRSVLAVVLVPFLAVMVLVGVMKAVGYMAGDDGGVLMNTVDSLLAAIGLS